MGIVVGEREYFKGIGKIAYEGPESDNPLAFRCYDEDRVGAGTTMRDHLRFAIAHIGGMDVFARALVATDRILNDSRYRRWRNERYASFDDGPGQDFESGRLGLEELHSHALEHGEPTVTSGKQELYEQLVNRYV
jgi:xylose isomerase